MTKFIYHTMASANEDAKSLIKKSEEAYGFLPKLHAVLAEAPITYEAYLDTFEAFGKSSLTPLEQQVVFMTSSYINNCHYCIPGHSMIMTMMKMPDEVIENLREGKTLKDPKLESLRVFTKAILEKRGHVSEDEIASFYQSGFSNKQALEILTGLASKLISNFTNAIAKTEIDEPVKKFSWTHPDKR